MKLIDEHFETAMEAWSMMQKTSGDEGAEWAERFERYFYDFIAAQIRFGRSSRSQAYGFICMPDMQGVTVSFAIHGNRVYAHFPCRSNDS